MVRYTKAFRDTVGGTLRARFDLVNGEPRYGVQKKTKFYFITLELDAPAAADIMGVTYLLDEATFWDPKRASAARGQRFAEEITSYGDFLVRVTVETRTGPVTQSALLSDLLEAGHATDMTDAIEKAIDYIRTN